MPGEVAAPTHSRPTPIILIQGKVLSQPHAPAPSTPGGLPETRQEGLAEALALRLPLSCFTPFGPHSQRGLCADSL